jgi:hypothetical protein
MSCLPATAPAERQAVRLQKPSDDDEHNGSDQVKGVVVVRMLHPLNANRYAERYQAQPEHHAGYVGEYLRTIHNPQSISLYPAGQSPNYASI